MVDDLTALASRGAFMLRLEAEIAAARAQRQALCLLVIDLDHLKIYNDLYGHLAGDAALRAAAEVLRTTLRGDDFPGRYGGDEFVAILPGASPQVGLTVARRLCSVATDTAIRVPGSAAELHLSLSIGLASLPDDGVDAQSLFAAADRGAYAAKAAGRNTVRHLSTTGGPALSTATAPPLQASRMVGRLAEFTRLRHILEAAASGRVDGGGSLAIVEGEAGIGKSRLLQEFEKLAGLLRVQVIQTSCQKAERRTPYFPWLPALTSLVSRAPLPLLQDAAGPYAGELARLLPVLGQRLPDSRPLAPLPLQEDRARLLDALVQLVLGLVGVPPASTPLAFIIDNLQWADEDSVRLLYRLAHLARRLPLLLLGTIRPEDLYLPHGRSANPALQEAVGELERQGLFRQRLALQPLSPGEMRALVQATVGAIIPPGLMQRLVAESGGNPLFLLETLRMAQAQGYLHLIKAWKRTGSGNLPLAPSLAALLAGRLAELDDAERELLALAALLPEPIEERLLIAAAPDPVGVQGTMARLERRGLLVRMAESQGHYRFMYRQLRAHVLEELDPPRRLALCHRVVRTIVAEGQRIDAALFRATATGERLALEVDTLGDFTLRLEGQEITLDSQQGARGRLLLQALLVTPRHVLPVQVVQTLLWPDDAAGPPSRLTRVLRDLTRGLGAWAGHRPAPVIVRRKDHLALHPDLDVSVDCERFEAAAVAALASGDPETLVAAQALYGGPLLPALGSADWVEGRRAHLAMLFERVQQRTASQPVGVVTVLQTSVIECDVLWETDPAATRAALDRYDRLLAEAVAHNRGHLTSQRGDDESRCAVFADPAAALFAAVQLAQALLASTEPGARRAGMAKDEDPASMSLMVRHSVYTGPVELREGYYSGATLHRCAQIRALAHPGQILVSQTTVEALPMLPEALDLRPLGSYVLPGTKRLENVFQAAHPSLPDSFPPLRGAEQLRATNVPAAVTSFVGRTREMLDITALLRTYRLVTLTGAGGVGKTRLAQQVAGTRLAAFPDGVWHSDLTSIHDQQLLTGFLAWTVGLRWESGDPTMDHLIEFLRPKQMLIILDNCEHLIEPCAELAAAVLRAAPGVRIIATSREPLDVAGESVYALTPLAAPDADICSLEQISRYDAVRLFVDRARARQSSIGLDAENATVIGRICARLDGLPLAIELAAARIGTQTPEEIARGLEDCFTVLNRGPRGTLPRHRSLRAALDWSYSLLTEQERALFRALAVFNGGWDLEAAGAVCGGDASAPAGIGPLLAGLVSKSLLLAGDQRYRLLETTRQYGWEQLVAEDELEERRDRHLAWCVALAERADDELRGANQKAWFDRLAVEHDNVRAALHWSLSQGVEPLARGTGETSRQEQGLRLAASMQWFWSVRNHWTEAQQWLQKALAANPNAPVALRAKALRGAGGLAERQRDFARAAALLEESLTLLRSLDDRQGVAAALRMRGNVALYTKDRRGAEAYYRESLALQREIGDTQGVAGTLNNLGIIAKEEGDYGKATALFSETLRACSEAGHRWGMAASLDNLGMTAQLQGDFPTALDLHQQSLAIWRELGDDWSIAYLQTNLGVAAHGNGEHARALALFRESLAGFRQQADLRQITRCLNGMAYCAAALDMPRMAAMLFAVTETLCSQAGVEQEFVNDADHPVKIASVRDMLGEPAFAEAWEEGSSLDLEQACALGLSIEAE